MDPNVFEFFKDHMSVVEIDLNGDPNTLNKQEKIVQKILLKQRSLGINTITDKQFKKHHPDTFDLLSKQINEVKKIEKK
jgi:hypothetical protein